MGCTHPPPGGEVSQEAGMCAAPISVRVIEVEDRDLRLMFALSNPVSQAHVRSYGRREPETRAWIWAMAPGSRLFDVGANIGLYTILAARRGISVCAFEPQCESYAELNRNIAVNACADRAVAYCLALSDVSRCTRLAIRGFNAGTVNHHLLPEGRPPASLGPDEFGQGCMSCTIDQLVYELDVEPPDHIKIDVDGHEGKVIAGAARYLADARLVSLLVEIDTSRPAADEIVKRIVSAGFGYDRDQAARNVNRGKGVGNFIFRRL